MGTITVPPGKEVALPPPPPLRTGRESCPSSSSSLHKRPSRDAVVLQRPSRYAPGADGPYARPSSRRGSASRTHVREPHQRAFLPPTYLLVSLSRLAKVLS
jgi:hypothetical protein